MDKNKELNNMDGKELNKILKTVKDIKIFKK